MVAIRSVSRVGVKAEEATLTHRPPANRNLPDWVRVQLWTTVSKCKGSDSRLFFAQTGSYASKKALEVCSECLVRTRCFIDSWEYGDEIGVWGMTTPQDRKEVKELVGEGKPLDLAYQMVTGRKLGLISADPEDELQELVDAMNEELQEIVESNVDYVGTISFETCQVRIAG